MPRLQSKEEVRGQHKKSKMAHGLNARQRNGKEWWGKRPLSMTSVTPKHGAKKRKRLLHKIERTAAKNQILTTETTNP